MSVELVSDLNLCSRDQKATNTDLLNLMLLHEWTSAYFIRLLHKRPLWIRILFIKLNIAELVNQSIRLATAVTESVVLFVYFCSLVRYFFLDCTESEGVLFGGVKVQIWISQPARNPLERRILLYCRNGDTVKCGIPWWGQQKRRAFRVVVEDEAGFFCLLIKVLCRTMQIT